MVVKIGWFASSSSSAGLSLILIVLTALNDGGYVFPATEAIWLTVPTSGFKCVSEQIQNNVVVLADFFAFDEHSHDEAPPISVWISSKRMDSHKKIKTLRNHLLTIKAFSTNWVGSPFGNKLYQAENVTHGQFAFTTTEVGVYLACFSVANKHQKNPIALGLDWKIGINAKDWDSVAKKENLEGVGFHVRRLKEIVEAIHTNLIHLKHREASMRAFSEETNDRVAWFSFMSLGVCIMVSVLQVLHLKRYFRKKKLI